MKKLLLILGLVILTGVGCSSTAAPATSTQPAVPSRAAFDVPVAFKVGQRITFRNGISFMLMAINDSRCKPGVQCIWAGELAPTFTYYDVDESMEQFMLGTVRNTKTNVKNYEVSLVSATTDQATITVSDRIK